MLKIDLIIKVYIVFLLYITIFFLLGVGYFTQPDYFKKGYSPKQPIPFSHRLHNKTMKIPCLYCHSSALTSRYAGIPTAEKCLNCHNFAKTESPYIKFIKDSFEKNKPIEWERVYFLPDYVYFDHRPHTNAGVDCQVCHQGVEDMAVMTQKMSMRMASCLGCHRNPESVLPKESKIEKGSEDCKICHR